MTDTLLNYVMTLYHLQRMLRCLVICKRYIYNQYCLQVYETPQSTALYYLFGLHGSRR